MIKPCDIKKLLYFTLLTFLAINLNAQVNIRDKVSFSISWTPNYNGPNDGKFNVYALTPLAFEANIHYAFAERFSISSGIGFQNWQREYDGWGIESVIDPTKSEKHHLSIVTLPVAISYKIGSEYFLPDLYLKTEFVNEFNSFKISDYQNNTFVKSWSNSDYSNSVNIGIGNYFSITNSLSILTECSIGTTTHPDPFAMYYIKLKLGVLIK